MAGMSVDATLVEPFRGDLPERLEPVAPAPLATVQPDNPLTLAEAYRSSIDDPTRAWTANTREAYETSRRLAVAVIGGELPVASIARTPCREFLDVL